MSDRYEHDHFEYLVGEYLIETYRRGYLDGVDDTDSGEPNQRRNFNADAVTEVAKELRNALHQA